MFDLNQYQVLVTRPEEQSSHFLDMINASNGTAVNFPTIAITASPLTDTVKQDLKNISTYNMAIFVSVNAVKYGLQALKSLKLDFPETLIVAAVGPSTAQALQENDIQVDIVPDDSYSSEGLLKTPELAEISGEKILIFKGQLGRELLSVQLKKRHAEVVSIDCYQRAIPQFDTGEVVKLLERGEINAVTVTSATGLNNLFKILGEASDLLLSIPFVAASARIADECEDLEIERISVADNAGDKAMLEALAELAEDANTLSQVDDQELE